MNRYDLFGVGGTVAYNSRFPNRSETRFCSRPALNSFITSVTAAFFVDSPLTATIGSTKAGASEGFVSICWTACVAGYTLKRRRTDQAPKFSVNDEQPRCVALPPCPLPVSAVCAFCKSHDSTKSVRQLTSEVKGAVLLRRPATEGCEPDRRVRPLKIHVGSRESGGV